MGDGAWDPTARFATNRIRRGGRGMGCCDPEPIAGQTIAEGHQARIDYTDEVTEIVIGEQRGLSALHAETPQPASGSVEVGSQIVWVFAGPALLAIAHTIDGFALVDLEAGRVKPSSCQPSIGWSRVSVAGISDRTRNSMRPTLQQGGI